MTGFAESGLWIVDATWRRLIAGSARVEELDRDLAEWAEPVARARELRAGQARASWLAAEDKHRREHEARVSAWEEREAVEVRRVERDRAEWAVEVGDARDRLRARLRVAATAGPASLAIAAAALALVGASTVVAGVVLLVVALAAGGPSGLNGWSLLALRRRDPAAGWRREPRPEPPAPAPPPAAEPEHPVATSIAALWAEELQVRRAPRGDFAYSEFGDEGEEIFLDVLARALTRGYLAIRGLLVARGLDADVLVVGPDGIWLFEVKHWSGTIVCRDGQWTRIRKPGGSWQQAVEPIKPFDRQWEREAEAIERTLGRRLASKHPFPAVRGGLVFTVADVACDLDESCRTGYGRPEDWVAAMVGGAAQEGDDEEPCRRETQLAILDALVGFGHHIDSSLSAASNDAVELAERLHGDAVAAARDYVASAGGADTEAEVEVEVEMPPSG